MIKLNVVSGWLLSGPGLYDLYRALADVDGVAVELPDDRSVVAACNAGEPRAQATVDRFCGILGSVAGCAHLRRGGVFVAGGIAPRIADRLTSSAFRGRFETKGRLSSYVREIPTSLVVHSHPAILGCARQLSSWTR